MRLPVGQILRKYGRVLSYARPQWRTIAALLGLTALAAMLQSLQPWPLKLLVDYGLENAPLPAMLSSTLALAHIESTPAALVVLGGIAAFALFLLTTALDALLTLSWTALGQRMVYALAGDLFMQLQRLSLVFHARRTVGDSLSRITDAWSVHDVAEGLLLSPVRQFLTVGSVALLAWHIDPGMTLLMLVSVPLLTVSALYFGDAIRRAERTKRDVMGMLNAFVHQAFSAIPVIQAFGAAPRNTAVFRMHANEAIATQRAAAAIGTTYHAVNALATTVAIALVVYVGGTRVLGGVMSLGSLLVLLAYVRTLEGATRGLFDTYGSLRACEAGVDRVLEVLDATEKIVEAPRARPLPPRSATSGRLTFERVTFGYVAGEPVLRDLSFEVQSGETLALVGATGAGKTTIASLVPRFFDPWQGRVLLDGCDLRELTLATVRGEVALVLQDALILPLTVAENIAYGRPDASREDVIAAAVAAHAHEFIRELPQGYDTVLSEEAADLSGGQRQRIAIARAMLKDARLLVMDEPTAALDPVSERAVVEALQKLTAGRTTIIIAHRLSTVRHATRIAVVDRGRIVEQGSHLELIAQGGKYAHLYALSTFGTSDSSP